MQTITHPQKNIHTIFNEFDNLYGVLSEKESKNILTRYEFSDIFKPLIELFDRYYPRKNINDQKYGLNIDCKQYVDDYIGRHKEYTGKREKGLFDI